ncbi:MAG TPA: response regulator [Proteobacteria bacterium]|nr:response regulator [Pseudomonadota bacterium]
MAKNSIAFRLFIVVLIVSLIAALLITAVRAWLDYRKAMSDIENTFKEIKITQLPVIRENLWVMDEKTVRTAMQGLLNISHLRHVLIEDKGRVIMEIGSIEAGDAMRGEFPLTYTYGGKTIRLGILKVDISRNGVFEELWGHVKVGLFYTVMMVFLVTFSIYFLFQFMFTRHLSDIAAYVKQIGIDGLEKELLLEKKKTSPQNPDEIDRIVSAINSMRLGLKTTFDELQDEIQTRKQVEEEKARMEEQYLQAQKVEAVGRLAGGVAHDLNNLLIPILGYGEMLRDNLAPDDARLKFIDGIMDAGFRARDLVSRLLAFGRKQTLEYRTIDLSKAVEGFEKLLRRTIREDIEIKVLLSPDIHGVMADLGQIEQVIMNLAVNAAEAMPGGGTLTIETTLADLDEEYAATHPEVEPGEYVMLVVSDTGCGMDDEVRKHIFEPFFTTKGEGGTGLGLATVHGIVRQHGGSIWFYSEPFKGTTFKIYLPVTGKVDAGVATVEKTAPTDLHGWETILLVEDNEHVREVSRAILEQFGYRVLSAESGSEALRVLEDHESSVHLLLTDVVMPGMNGRDLFTQASA